MSRRTCAAAALGVGLIVASCGGTDFTRRTAAPSGDPGLRAPATTVVRNPGLQATVLRSVSRTEASRTARTSISVTLTGLGNDALSTGAFDIAGTGVVNLANGDADLALSIPLFDRLGGGGAIEQRIVRGVAYTRMPAGILRRAGLPASIVWLSLDLKQAVGADPSARSQSQVDPAGQLAFIAAASADIRTVGNESVRGAPSTHYAATIDLAKFGLDAHRTAKLRTKLAPLGAATGSRQLALDVWLDRAGRARRVVVSIPLSPQSASVLRIQGDFYAFGTPVRVAAPPQSQVRPYSSLRIGAAKG